MSASRFEALLAAGQSVWLDNLSRDALRSGELRRRVEREGLRGVTSNPAIFEKAIRTSELYAEQLAEQVRAGAELPELYEALVLDDIRAACDALRPVWDDSHGVDGYVSLELSPHLAHDTVGSLRDARRLFREVDRPNVMIKIPGTAAGAPAIEEALFEGVHVNVTLLFSVASWRAVAEAHLRALERRVEAGLPAGEVHSVASFFLSRIDALVDRLLGQRIQPARTENGERPQLLQGRVAVANAKLAYREFQELHAGERWRKLAREGAKPQRMLWASTSTKNPLYDELRYVEPLIGPHTVNTMPDATLEAFSARGAVRRTVDEDLDEAQGVLERLARCGVDLDRATAQLLDEGVQKFIAPFDALMRTLARRREALLQDRLARWEVQPKAAQETLQETCAALDERRAVRRIFARDASLWVEPERARTVVARLGWLDAPRESAHRLNEVRAVASRAHSEGYEHLVLLGMGGSSLAPQVGAALARESVGEAPLTVLDDTDPDAVAHVLDRTDPARTLHVVASKSGTTLETLSLLRLFFARAQAAVGERAGDRFVAITDPGTPLAEQARRLGFAHVFENQPDVGGRYSALTGFGLLPMALAGVDVQELLVRGLLMRASCGAHVPADANPGAALGALLGRLALEGRDKLTLVAEDGWEALGPWIEQLVAESTGKRGRGIVPVVGEPLGAPEAYGDDRVFVLHCGAGGPSDATAARLEALQAAGHPVLRFLAPDALALGGELFRWELATAVAGSVLGVDPFDEPDVAAAKRDTSALLERWGESEGLDEGEVALEEHGVAVHGGPTLDRIGSRSLAGVLQGLADLAEPGDCFALLAWMRRTERRAGLLEALRLAVRARRRVATTLGFGPRYLHSTGQLHKGGPDRGVFLLLSADPAQDRELVDEPYGFATLHRAQALGDLAALERLERRVVRVHLGRDAEAGLQRLVESLG